MTMTGLKKLCLICCFAILPLMPTSMASAQADTYSVIYQEISAHNGNYQEADWIAKAILYASDLYGVDPLLVTAVMEQESGFNLQAGSGAGAVGLMQLMPDTANMIGVNPYNPLDNIIGGVIYLKNQLDNFSGWGQYAVTDAIAAYNAGPQAVKNYGGVPPYNETRNYVISIADNYNRLNSYFG